MSRKLQSGQILLITVMLVATAITVVMTLVFKSTTETQITKLEEESQRALVAAEAALEKALKTQLPPPEYSLKYDATGLNLTNLTGIDLTASSVSLDIPATASFVSPLTQKDEAYTFYFTGYNNVDHVFDTNYFSDNLTFYFGSESPSFSCSGSRTTPALELTLISSTNAVTRKLIEPCGALGTSDLAVADAGYTLNSVSFKYKTTTTFTVSNTKVIIVRPFFSSTKIGIVGSVNLKPQGNYYVSEARSYSGVTRKIQLFQAYPQIPAEFFVTSF